MFEANLAHKSAVKLNEGEVIEMRFRPSDGDAFFHVSGDRAVYAEVLEVEDATGTVYPVVNSKNVLSVLLDAWERC